MYLFLIFKHNFLFVITILVEKTQLDRNTYRVVKFIFLYCLYFNSCGRNKNENKEKL